MMIPPLFIDRIQTTFPDGEGDAFLGSLTNEPAVSIRLHPSKKNVGFVGSHSVPWNTEGFYLPQRPEFIFDPAFHAGAYYVQESSSMFIKKALEKIDLPSHAVVLDLCAAPGGKSTLLLSHFPSDTLVVANEVIRTRIPALKENIQRWGYPNAVITNADPADFEVLYETFDVIVVDAPCSGEGMFRKDPDAAKHWSPDALQTCELRQKRILASAIKAVKPGGYLIYSTCTFNAGENEAQVNELLSQGFEFIPILSDSEFPEIERVRSDGRKMGYAFYPHRVKGEGFYLALLRKSAEFTEIMPTETKMRKPFFSKTIKPDAQMQQWIQRPDEYVWKERNETIYVLPKNLEKNIELITSSVHVMYAGMAAGIQKGGDFLPEHALALSVIVNNNIPHIEFTEEESLKFLKKESIRSYELPKGIYVVRYQGLNLGWVKAVPGRLNNLLPMEFRIRKNIEW